MEDGLPCVNGYGEGCGEGVQGPQGGEEGCMNTEATSHAG